MPTLTPPPGQIYQLKVTLKGSKPPIWRRVEVAATVTLAQLHEILQVTMGWYDSHLHQFVMGDVFYGLPDPDGWDDVEVCDERLVKLNQLLNAPKQKLVYEYDFGDAWEHQVVLEQILAPNPAITYPRCTTGKRACPPEDCGGIWGYASLLEAIHDVNHPEHADTLEWIGEDFDPEEFDLEAVNSLLQEEEDA